MSKSFRFLLAAVCLQLSTSLALAERPNVDDEAPKDALSEKSFEFTYSVEVPAIPAGQGPVDIFIPLGQSDDHQDIKTRKVTASIPGTEQTEKVNKNQFWHGHLDQSDGKPITVSVTYDVTRRPHEVDLQELAELTYDKEDLVGEELHLKADRLTPISGEIIEKVQKDIPKTATQTPVVRAKAIYDYVVDNMEYKKVGTGWGNGDTHWACSQKYGNCTDFHALFISLARAEKIPSKFEIGFPIPEDKTEGEIGGYHCWVTFKLPAVGWAPIDASEAKKHPAKRELLFGTHPADRIKLSEGRDLQLGEGHTTGPLNFFVFPHVEVKKEKLDSVVTKASFRALTTK